jgi:hypothetical protein
MLGRIFFRVSQFPPSHEPVTKLSARLALTQFIAALSLLCACSGEEARPKGGPVEPATTRRLADLKLDLARRRVAERGLSVPPGRAALWKVWILARHGTNAEDLETMASALAHGEALEVDRSGLELPTVICDLYGHAIELSVTSLALEWLVHEIRKDNLGLGRTAGEK